MALASSPTWLIYVLLWPILLKYLPASSTECQQSKCQNPTSVTQSAKLQRFLQATSIGVGALLILNCSCGFGGTMRPLASMSFKSAASDQLRELFTGLLGPVADGVSHVPLPIPATYLEYLDALFLSQEQSSLKSSMHVHGMWRGLTSLIGESLTKMTLGWIAAMIAAMFVASRRLRGSTKSSSGVDVAENQLWAPGEATHLEFLRDLVGLITNWWAVLAVCSLNSTAPSYTSFLFPSLGFSFVFAGGIALLAGKTTASHENCFHATC